MVRGEHLSRRKGRRGGTPPEVHMYDVLYLDHEGSALTVASQLDRAAAAQLARTEAHRRRTGRMFLAGSERPCRGDIVVIVSDKDKTLQAA
ncbi:MAG: hypothetical protein ACRDLO_05675 [Solirubrobacterales bacterium]